MPIEVISWYQTRWVIEEFHKAMKTGCQIEELQFTDDAERLEPMTIACCCRRVATTLLNLRAACEQYLTQKPAPAHTVIDAAYVEVLERLAVPGNKEVDGS